MISYHRCAPRGVGAWLSVVLLICCVSGSARADQSRRRPHIQPYTIQTPAHWSQEWWGGYRAYRSPGGGRILFRHQSYHSSLERFYYEEAGRVSPNVLVSRVDFQATFAGGRRAIRYDADWQEGVSRMHAEVYLFTNQRYFYIAQLIWPAHCSYGQQQEVRRVAATIRAPGRPYPDPYPPYPPFPPPYPPYPPPHPVDPVVHAGPPPLTQSNAQALPDYLAFLFTVAYGRAMGYDQWQRDQIVSLLRDTYALYPYGERAMFANLRANFNNFQARYARWDWSRRQQFRWEVMRWLGITGYGSYHPHRGVIMDEESSRRAGAAAESRLQRMMRSDRHSAPSLLRESMGLMR